MPRAHSRYENMAETIELPSQLKIGEFVEARMEEIADLEAAVAQPRQGQAAAQQLPRHLRRRAVAHNPNRLPRRLRQRHCAERQKSSSASLLAAKKRPSRKHRRRPSQLLSEYNRRQSGARWLETHIWHAKRFNIVQKWGYKLPDAPNDKAFRATFRASKRKALLIDVSYLACLQIQAEDGEEVLLVLKRLCPDLETLKAETEKSLWLFRPNSHPKGIVGRVSFMLKPDSDFQLWIWIHPAFYEEAKDIICAEFDVIKEENSESTKPKDSKLALKNVPASRAPAFTNGRGIRITELKDTLNRFRLIGPQSRRILQRTLIKSDQGGNDAKNLATSVAGFVVRDPRVILPRKRHGIEAEEEIEIDTTPLTPHGPIWDASARDESSLGRCPNVEINRMRSELLIPGSTLPLTESESRVPCLTIGRESGYDLVTPAGWGVAFWVNLYYNGARVGGQRELRQLALDSAAFGEDVVADSPDSRAGSEHMDKEADLLRAVFFKSPPDKRCNHVKLGFAAPFGGSGIWPRLFMDFGVTDTYHVLRNETKLKAMQNALKDRKALIWDEEDLEAALIPISVETIAKGNFGPNSAICLPKEEDFEASSTSAEEPIHSDSGEKARAELKRNHAKEKVRLRRKWKKIKEELKVNKSEETLKRLEQVKALREEKSAQFNSTMKTLWTPNSSSLRYSASRETLGFVINAGFSNRVGKVVGVGFVPFVALKALFCDKVLVRDSASAVYRLAKLSVRTQ